MNDTNSNDVKSLYLKKDSVVLEDQNAKSTTDNNASSNVNFYDSKDDKKIANAISEFMKSMDNIDSNKKEEKVEEDNINIKASDIINNLIKTENKNSDSYNKFISFDGVSKKYNADSMAASTLALDNISFDIKEGELVIFLGHSGAGKTTALNLLGGMDTVTGGRITVGDKVITNYTIDKLTEYRKNDIGFIFQSYNLIQNLTVKENISLAIEVKKENTDVSEILDKVGLKDKIDAYPSELSGGEQQRVAIARAIAKKPKILLCDEPTGALDYRTGKQILSLIQQTCKEEKVTTIIITHNQQVVDMADKIICFNSGKISKIVENDNPMDVMDLEW